MVGFGEVVLVIVCQLDVFPTRRRHEKVHLLWSAGLVPEIHPATEKIRTTPIGGNSENEYFQLARVSFVSFFIVRMTRPGRNVTTYILSFAAHFIKFIYVLLLTCNIKHAHLLF